MPDISMCTLKICPQKESCYRHAASGTKPSDWQAYFVPPHDESGKCLSYLPTVQNKNAKDMAISPR